MTDLINFSLNKQFWLFLFIFRIVNACLCVSYYYPDELSQSVEVAYDIVFKNGWLTGEWREKEGGDIYGIRASFHPLLYAVIYFLLKVFHLDHFHFIFVNAPKVLNGSLAFLMDYSIYRYTFLRVGKNTDFGRNVAKTTLIFSTFCFANCFLGIRFFSNSLETILTSVGIWLWAEVEHKFREIEEKESSTPANVVWPLVGFTWVVFFTVFLRYSNLIIWAPHAILFFFHDGAAWRGFNFKYIKKRFCLLFQLGWKNYFLVLFLTPASVVAIQFLCDWYVYGKPVIPLFRNFVFNILEGKSSRWAVEPAYFYIANGFLFFLLAYVVPFAAGLAFDRQCLREFAIFVALLLSLSAIGHKEARFLYPAAPFLVSIAARGMHVEWQGWNAGSKKKELQLRLKRGFVIFVIVLNLIVAWLFTRTILERPLYDALAMVRECAARNETGLFLGIKVFYFPLQSYFHLDHLLDLWHFADLEGDKPRECWNHEHCRPFAAAQAWAWADNMLVYKKDWDAVRERLRIYDLDDTYDVRGEFHSRLDSKTDVLFLARRKGRQSSLRG